MIKNVNEKYNDYFTSPKIRQILLHWGYELVENGLLWFALWQIFFFNNFCSYENEKCL